MKNRVQTFLVRFKNPITFEQTPALRSGVLKAMEYNANILFHNHADGETLRYAYPLIQYKRIQGKAAILGIGEGVNVIGEFLSHPTMQVLIDSHPVTLEIERAIPRMTTAQLWESEYRYTVRKWLPLNKDNYDRYRALSTDEEKVAFLQRVLTANILSFFKGMGITIEREIKCRITHITNGSLYKFKGTKLMAFDAEFTCNASIPNYVGIGRHVSVGFGCVVACAADTAREHATTADDIQ